MKARQFKNIGLKRPSFNRDAIVLAMIAVACSPAFAQFDKGKEGLNMVQVGLLGLAAVCITIAIMWTGFRMAYQAAQWKDCAAWFWGGLLIGSAPAIAAMII
ncbi:TrbC/VirB2 family protein [Variovorax sp. LT1P1]|uniref:TrbC/VirB2 family protein n=1 Tax=Variovorax sp. LT1P1 TaxID=3443730 RepID=UPI003F45168B